MDVAVGTATGDTPAVTAARLRFSRLEAYMALVCLAGLPLAVWTLLQLRTAEVGDDVAVLAVLVVVLVVGELLPIEVSRRGRISDEITISTTFALALVFIAPLGLVVLAQALPLVFDDVRRRKHWSRPLFNTAQYTLSLVAARLTYCTLADKAFWAPSGFDSGDLVAAFAAGAAFFVINHTCVSAAVGLSLAEPVLRHLREDLRFQVSTSGLLVCVAPLVVVASDFSLALVPVLLLPIAAVRISAQLATQREHDALHDGLTGLPNRVLLHHEVERALREAASSGGGLAVLMADLDHFKEINDTLGHDVGDMLITEVGNRLSAVAGEDAVVARLGGDEFALLLPVPAGTSCEQSAVALAFELVEALKQPVTLAGVRLDVQASIGIALAPQHGSDITQLMARADVAMYVAKEDRGSWAVYDPELDDNTPQRLTLLAELRDGLGRDELVVHYQPKCETRSGEVVGVEALVRWQHPVRGLLMPDSFIPIAENTALITPITLHVLECAVRQMRVWADSGRRIGVSVNLSVRHLTDLELPEQVDATLRRHGVAAGQLTLEVTESTIMNDPSRAVIVLSRLRALGVRIAVDDYGTGYSSLAYLKRLAVDELKIDKTFIMGMRTDENDAVIVRSTIELGHNLGLQLVAEGVEDVETWQMLLPLGCDVLQGYHLSRPLPADALTAWFDAWNASLALPSERLPRVLGQPLADVVHAVRGDLPC
jgi:diguanylate cyclase (GGDEF)-like protein